MRVTIITPIRHRPEWHFPLAAIVEAQTHRAVEHIVVEEVSSWRKHAEPIASSIYHLCQKPTFISKKLNEATEMAKGELIVIMHSDDFYSPYYVEALVRQFKSDKSLQVAAMEDQWGYNLVDRKYELIKPTWSSGCIAFRAGVLKKVKFPNFRRAEGRSFLKRLPSHDIKPVRLDSMRQNMLRLWHGKNAFTPAFGRSPDLDLDYLRVFVKDENLRLFYSSFYRPEPC